MRSCIFVFVIFVCVTGGLTPAAHNVLDSPILYVAREQYRSDHHNTATMFQKGEINAGSFRGGSQLKIWNPKDNTVEILLNFPEGIVRDPCISFDAKKVLLSIRQNKDDDYHICEYEFCTKKLTQLTFLPGVSDIDPLYVPSANSDGSCDIVFSSTREPKYCMCNRHIMCNLYKMNGDGSNVQQIGKSTLFEGHSSLTPDGRILYDRWEYIDRNFGDAQGLWVTSTDGFNHSIWWGNNTSTPGAIIDARMLPGSSSVFIATFSSCHDRPWGAIAVIDRQKGIDGKQAVLQTFPPDAINLVEDTDKQAYSLREVFKYDTFVKVNPKFEDPFPLSADWYLASGTFGKGEKTGIYLLGKDGTMELVFDDKDAGGCFDPMPVKATTPPPVNTQKADLSQSTGVFYVSNVYEGFGMSDVKKGSVKYLRVIESPEKQTWSPKGWSNGHGEQAPGMNWFEFINKRVIGTVPVEEDGSVNFVVPADTFVYFQILDEDERMIQSMRSGVIIRPGETNGCAGCHEDRLTVVPAPQKTPLALTKPPRTLTPWYGEPRLFSYVKEVQPVFDKYCTRCHDYKEKDEERENNSPSLNLAGDLNNIFNTSYVELYRRQLIKPIGAGPHIKLKPFAWGSTQSKLSDVLLAGHAAIKELSNGDKIDAKRRELGMYIDGKTNREAVSRVITWIDLNAPYYPVYQTSFPDNRFGRSPLTDQQLNRLSELCGFKEVVKSGGNSTQLPLDWQISFTRPELSPCLASLRGNASDERYKEALAIIEAGKTALQQTPRGDDGSIALTLRDKIQMEKYQQLKDIENKFRNAIERNEKLFDKNFQTTR
ncbi:MAG: hypothetical protein FWE67_00245 [Planctomycetaceae bacterium]|nr:hypothetical protein [Planctomycetaceae bacterium]